MYRQVPDVQAQEDEPGQLGEVVVPQLKVEYHQGLALQHAHRAADVLLVGELAEDVQAVLLHHARARHYLRARRTLLLLLEEGGGVVREVVEIREVLLGWWSA